MKNLLLFLILIFIIPSSMATVLLEDSVKDGETFKVGDHNFQLQYMESNQDVIFRMDGTGGIMSAGECETRNDIKYCYDGASYPDIYVKIESLEPDLRIERSFSTDSPSLGEEIIVKVTLKNEGDKTAQNIVYTDSYPADLRVFYDGNSMVWKGSLNVADEESFSYKIRAEEIISYDSVAKLSYQFDGKKKTKSSSSVRIEVQTPYGINDKISTEAADKKEVVTYDISIKNKDPKNRMNVEKLEINIPSNINLVSKSSELKKSEDKLTFTGILGIGESKTFFVKVAPKRVGKFTLSTKAQIEISGKEFKEELERTFSVGLSDILPILNMSSEVNSNSPYNVYVGVKNYGKEKINSVIINVESDLFDNIDEKKSISAGDTYEVLEKRFTAPYSEEDRIYNVKVTGSYISSSGRTYTFDKSSRLTVKAAPKVIQITRELNKEEFYPGDDIQVTIKIKNQKNQVIDAVDVSDIFPKEIRSSLLGEVTTLIDYLEANEEKKAYSYSVVVPDDYEQDEIEFKTMLNSKVDGELVILKRIDNVKILHGEKPAGETEEEQVEGESTSQEENLEETEDTDEIKIEEEVKSSVLSKFVGWIKNIFKRN
ncbi:MAG: hypothetical protein U9O94_08275 [Nanoarchaeota archaeon]|nr:hypothetical protein [Nanoarchaeota archaeon]